MKQMALDKKDKTLDLGAKSNLSECYLTTWLVA